MSQRSSLFVFAHQDDEFGCYAAIADAVAAGERVLCVFVTDGALGGDPVRRDAESRAVLTALGVDASDLHFVGVPNGIRDGKLYESLPAVARVLGEWFDRVPAGSRIHVPAWEGGHHDHDALHAVAVLLLHDRGRLADARQFSLYNAHRRPGPLFRVLSPLLANGPIERRPLRWRERRRHLRDCLRYPTQRTTWLGLFPFVLWHMLWRGSAALQPVSVARVHERPHPGRLYYEKRGFLGYDVLRAAIDDWRRASGGAMSRPDPSVAR